MRLVAAIAMLVLVDASAQGDDPIAAAAYPGARLTVERSVEGKSLHLHFHCYASADPLAKVAAFYEKDKRFALAHWKMEKDERAFALRADPDLHVMLFPAANASLHKQCETKPEPADQTLLQITQARPR